MTNDQQTRQAEEQDRIITVQIRKPVNPLLLLLYFPPPPLLPSYYYRDDENLVC